MRGSQYLLRFSSTRKAAAPRLHRSTSGPTIEGPHSLRPQPTCSNPEQTRPNRLRRCWLQIVRPASMRTRMPIFCYVSRSLPSVRLAIQRKLACSPFRLRRVREGFPSFLLLSSYSRILASFRLRRGTKQRPRWCSIDVTQFPLHPQRPRAEWCRLYLPTTHCAHGQRLRRQSQHRCVQ